MSVTLPARSLPARTALGVELASVGLVTLGLGLVLPYALISVLGGGLFRTAYPAYVLAAAALIISKHRPLYPIFVLATFAFSPFLRRVADYQAGFAVFNLILLGPYIGLLPTLPALLRRALGGSRDMVWPFSVMLGCIVYAMFIALYHMALVAALFEALRWLLPVAMAAFIMAEPLQAEAVRRGVVQGLCMILPVLTVYGVEQFLSPPQWDIYWMWNVGNDTFGQAEAFKIRVFSMMNAPGPVAVFSAYAMILLAGDSLIALAIATATLPLLGLTLLRTAWLALGAGMVALVLRASGRRRLILLAGIGGICFAATALLTSEVLPPEISNLVADRLSTFTQLGTDTSANARLDVYDQFFARLSASPWGEGFGANASTVSLAGTKKDLVSIDSGLLEAFLVYGILAGTLYFVALGSFVFEAWRLLPRLGAKFDGNFAVVCGLLAIMPLGTTQIGETGIVVWTALGTLFAGAEALQLRPRSAAGADGPPRLA
jgi:hypothetical protein